MTGRTLAFCIAGAASLLLQIAEASAQASQERCPEGRTRTGECVDAELAVSTRKQVVISAHPKFSYTAPQNAPREDRMSGRIGHLHEEYHLFTEPALTTTTPTFLFQATTFPMPRP